MSHYLPESELSRFNRAPAHTPFKVSPAFARVTRFALEMSRRSAGAFDPTLGPLINLWGFGEQGERLVAPSEVDLKEVLEIVGAGRISVTEQNELVKDIPELSLNLSGVAKGFGVDEMVKVLVQHGFTNCYAAIAGEVRGLGLNARGTKWQIGVSLPVSHWREDDPFAGVASLSNQAISTSGDYQKFFTDAQGQRLSHIIDPRTGWPVRHNVGGVTVVGPDSMTADALATTLFVLGCEEGLKFIENWTNAAALFIVREAGESFRQVASSRFTQMTGYQPE
jgi:thiamine biosynthesis lipoprotein